MLLFIGGIAAAIYYFFIRKDVTTGTQSDNTFEPDAPPDGIPPGTNDPVVPPYTEPEKAPTRDGRGGAGDPYARRKRIPTLGAGGIGGTKDSKGTVDDKGEVKPADAPGSKSKPGVQVKPIFNAPKYAKNTNAAKVTDDIPTIAWILKSTVKQPYNKGVAKRFTGVDSNSGGEFIKVENYLDGVLIKREIYPAGRPHFSGVGKAK